MSLKSLGKNPSGPRLERIKQSPGYRGDSFQNILETPVMSKNASYITMMKEFFGKGVDREPVKVIPSVKTDLRSLVDSSIVWFGHSSYLIRVNGKNILVDPVFSERTSPFQFIGKKAYPGSMAYSAEDMPALDVIVITHDHYDHLDHTTILKLKSKASLFCTSLGVGSHLEYWGVDPKKIIEFDWWDHHTILPDIELTATPARHFSGRGLTRNKTRWSSFVLQTSSTKIFIGGDSGYDASFKKIGNKYGPFDIVILECGQYDTMWPLIHMMPEETVQTAIDLQGNVLLPVHWGKFTLGFHPWYDPIKRVTNSAAKLNQRITTPLIGEVIEIGKSYPASRWWDAIL